MSRNLPRHPNLEFLKKQAKDLLHDTQERDPAFKLSDAQYAIAREYGFPSWPKLKAYVESVSGPTTAAAALVGEVSQGPEENAAVNADLSGNSRSEEAEERRSPFVGTWTANLSKSRQHALNQFQMATLDFDVVGDTVTIRDIVVDASGHEERTSNTLQADGKEHQTGRGDKHTLLARWIGSHVIEAVVSKDGQVEGRVRYEVSADGSSLTISTDSQVIVCDRN